MAQLVEILESDGHYMEVPEGTQGDLRVGQLRWAAYLKAHETLRKAEKAMLDHATTPVFVTPDQEDTIRAIAKPGAWIVVKEPTLVFDLTASPAVPEADLDAVPLAPAPPVPVVPAGPPQRPRFGSCPARSGLPHAALRYILTDEMSQYDAGCKRVDGLCQCGTRLPDVACPHQKQQPDGLKRPSCAWCHKLIVASGFVDNRLPDGKLDPRIKLAVNAASDGKDAPGAYRPT